MLVHSVLIGALNDRDHLNVCPNEILTQIFREVAILEDETTLVNE